MFLNIGLVNSRRSRRRFVIRYPTSIPRCETTQTRQGNGPRFTLRHGFLEPDLVIIHLSGYVADCSPHLRHFGTRIFVDGEYVSGGIDWYFRKHSQVSQLATLHRHQLIGRIFTVPKLGEKLKQDSIPLSYTPRKFISHPTDTVFYMIESDHRTHGPAATQRIIAEKVSFATRTPEGITDSIGSFRNQGRYFDSTASCC
jgi:hypothetical protein